MSEEYNTLNDQNPEPVEPVFRTERAGLVERAKNILTNPKREWEVVASEVPDVGGIITGYVIPLALVPAVAILLAAVLLGGGLGLAFGIGQAVVTLIAAVLSVLLSAAIINALAGTFDAKKDFGRAVQLVAYASTPSWVLGILNLIPFMIFIVPWIGIAWSIYLYYLGLGPVMKTPQGKEIGYMIVAAIAMIVVYFVIAAILGGILLLMVGGVGAASSYM